MFATVESNLPVDRDWYPITYFARHLIASRDQDPVYPLLRALSDLRHYDEESALWLSVLYQTFYHLPSALEAIRRVGDIRGDIYRARLDQLPTGIERRGLRGGLVTTYLGFLLDAVREAGSLRAFLAQGWGADPYENYGYFQYVWQQIHFNGRWSSFKMAEILKVAHGMRLAAPDMDLLKATGPRQSLEYLYCLEKPAPTTLNRSGDEFRDRLQNALRQQLDWETVETVLCNWNSVRQGRYYVGHDIDELLQQLDRATFLSQEDAADLLTARANALPDAYLGEWHDWNGVSKSRQRAWLDTGLIVTRP